MLFRDVEHCGISSAHETNSIFKADLDRVGVGVSMGMLKEETPTPIHPSLIFFSMNFD